MYPVSSRVWSVVVEEKCIFSEGYFRVALLKTAGAVFDGFYFLVCCFIFVVMLTLELVVGSLTTPKHRQPVI